MNETATQIFNSNVDLGMIVKNVIFSSSYINDLIIKILAKTGIPFNETQITVLLGLVYVGLLLSTIRFLETAKKPLKIIIIGLIIYLIIGFFKPI